MSFMVSDSHLLYYFEILLKIQVRRKFRGFELPIVRTLCDLNLTISLEITFFNYFQNRIAQDPFIPKVVIFPILDAQTCLYCKK